MAYIFIIEGGQSFIIIVIINNKNYIKKYFYIEIYMQKYYKLR